MLSSCILTVRETIGWLGLSSQLPVYEELLLPQYVRECIGSSATTFNAYISKDTNWPNSTAPTRKVDSLCEKYDMHDRRSRHRYSRFRGIGVGRQYCP